MERDSDVGATTTVNFAEMAMELVLLGHAQPADDETRVAAAIWRKRQRRLRTTAWGTVLATRALRLRRPPAATHTVQHHANRAPRSRRGRVTRARAPDDDRPRLQAPLSGAERQYLRDAIHKALDAQRQCRDCERWLDQQLDFYAGRKVCKDCHTRSELERYHARKAAA